MGKRLRIKSEAFTINYVKLDCKIAIFTASAVSLT